MSTSPAQFLRGKKVFLRAVHEEDLPVLTAWLNDPEIYSRFHMYKPLRGQELQNVIDKISTSENRQVFSICLHNGELIGANWLNDINWVNRNAITAAFIGPREHRGKGFGTDSKMLLCYHCFFTLNLHKLSAQAYDFNMASLRYIEKCGYREEGRRREQYFHAGKYWDMIETGLLRSDWIPIWEKYRADGADIKVPSPISQ